MDEIFNQYFESDFKESIVSTLYFSNKIIDVMVKDIRSLVCFNCYDEVESIEIEAILGIDKKQYKMNSDQVYEINFPERMLDEIVFRNDPTNGIKTQYDIYWVENNKLSDIKVHDLHRNNMAYHHRYIGLPFLMRGKVISQYPIAPKSKNDFEKTLDHKLLHYKFNFKSKIKTQSNIN